MRARTAGASKRKRGPLKSDYRLIDALQKYGHRSGTTPSSFGECAAGTLKLPILLVGSSDIALGKLAY
jgi:hypothetical protein